MSDYLISLIPSSATHMLACVALMYLIWWILKFAQPQWVISAKTPIILGVGLSLFFTLGTVTSLVQNQAVINRMKEKTKVPFDGLPPGEAAQKIHQTKNSFLSTVENLVANPVQLTESSKQALFEQFSILFPHGKEDKTVYRDQMTRIYNCQKIFYEDALQALKIKKTVKSEARQNCQILKGDFFGRDLLVPEDVARANDETIASVASNKKLIQNGQEIKVDEGYLRQGIEEQTRKLQTLSLLFE